MGSRTVVTGVCKSCKPYFVRGSWHYPQTHYEYEEFGLASWYGPGFHGKPKATGEIFNQHAMTAAHKILPLPAVVEVTDINTGKTIVVVVDDRGPFVYDGRIIDLSLGAAKALGCYQKGVAKVRVRCLVHHSKALSDHLARHGSKGRPWVRVYHEEIAPRLGTYSQGTEFTFELDPSPTAQDSKIIQISQKKLGQARPQPPSQDLTRYLKQSAYPKKNPSSQSDALKDWMQKTASSRKNKPSSSSKI